MNRGTSNSKCATKSAKSQCEWGMVDDGREYEHTIQHDAEINNNHNFDNDYYVCFI